MTLTDYGDLLVRALVLSGASAGVSQLVKYPLQVLLTTLHRYPESGTRRRLWVGGLRFGAALAGTLLATAPGLWPDWLPPAWHPLIGLCAGISSSAVYDAWLRIVHKAPAAIDAAVRARLGAPQAGDSEPLSISDTGTVETER